MNILFFLTPKCDVAYVKEEDSLRNTLEKMEFHRYSAIPVLSKDGKFAGTLTEGDLLWEIKNQLNLDLKEAEKVLVKDIPMRKHFEAVGINSSMEGLVARSLTQNFVPVVDDLGHFIGIVKRRDLMDYLYRHADFVALDKEESMLMAEDASLTG
ncbi:MULTISPECIES: CBS domain-containing protein [Oribacterium]|jgi:CBS domain protein|uniref:CBS domain-containing protein n=1 Tax=Oribacterium sinus TaxID=237576 RepID=A0A930GXP3_9FIRM|nr:CBS domain-containing protein [Oribacterium sinus]MBF1272717.1 CBS domain-containing protein [Oribacterium sinus]